MSYLSELNPPQRAAVERTEGPLMVIAGAGSGKTRVLTYRIIHLMNKGVDPFNILSLTFTNKAAREMKERIAAKVNASEAKNLWMGTFHSVFAKILRVEGGHLGYPSNFTIYDQEDARKVVKNILKELQLDTDVYKPNQVQSRISAFKNSLITVKSYWKNPELQEQDNAARRSQMGIIYEKYLDSCFRSGAMDFDDLLLKTNELFYRFPDVLAKYQDRFKYILVDEYQDTNHAQYRIVKSLASKFENICVVGDDAQSIYAFRGANIENILNFQKDYKDAEIIKLEQNYRSTDVIVKAANSIIAKNKSQIQKNVWTSNAGGEKIPVHKTFSENEEGQFVANSILERQLREQEPYSSFAILYRTNAQSRALEEALRKRNIPYRIYGGLSFYQRKEVKDLLAYFRLTINANDEEALRRVINYPARGIGNTTVDRITLASRQHDKSMWEVLENLAMIPTGINAGGQRKLEDFKTQIESYKVLLQESDAFDLAMHIAKNTGLLRELDKDQTPEGISRYENVQELLNGIKEFTEQENEKGEEGNPTLPAYMEDIALITDSDKEDKDDKNKVALMTIHLAKGLEFPHVFIVGLEENLFPSMMSSTSREDLEEERRLFYVALTRAEKSVALSFALSRYRWGKIIDGEPSRFIEEIDDQFLDIQFVERSENGRADDFEFEFDKPVGRRSYDKSAKKPSAKAKPSSAKAQPKKFVPKPEMKNLKKVQQAAAPTSGESALNLDIQTGSKVQHERFGIGVITSLEGEGTNKKATIQFDIGEKKLLLRFAKLTLV